MQRLAWRYLLTDVVTMKGITLFYNLLQDKTSFCRLSPFVKWEMDIGHTFSDFQWLAALRATFKATLSTSLWELTHKVTLRWYVTLTLVDKMYSNVSPLC